MPRLLVIAAVLVSGEKLKSLSLEQQRRAVKIKASVLTTDPWQEACQILPDVNTLTRNAANQAYEKAGVGPEDLDLVELHDCFATAELVHYDNLMLCEEGGAVDFSQPQRIAVEVKPTGDANQRFNLEVYWNDALVHRVENLKGITPRASWELHTDLYAEGTRVDVVLDDYRLVRRKET